MDINRTFETLCKHDKFFDFRDFSNIDNSEDGAYLVQSMYKLFALPTIQAIKKRAIKLLGLKSGDSAIEFGCGLGHDTEMMSEIVGDKGLVVAIDSSKLMLTEAQKHIQSHNIQYILSDIKNLNYADNTFSAAYADRLLVSQKNPQEIVKALVRITKPHGKVCISDLDAGSAILFPYREKLTQILKEQLQNIIRHPFIGRELHYILQQQGLANIQIFPEAYIVQSFDLVNTMIDFPRMITDLYKLGRYSREDALTMLRDFYTADANNTFLYGITLFTAVGTKPN